MLNHLCTSVPQLVTTQRKHDALQAFKREVRLYLGFAWGSMTLLPQSLSQVPESQLGERPKLCACTSVQGTICYVANSICVAVLHCCSMNKQTQQWCLESLTSPEPLGKIFSTDTVSFPAPALVSLTWFSSTQNAMVFVHTKCSQSCQALQSSWCTSPSSVEQTSHHKRDL